MKRLTTMLAMLLCCFALCAQEFVQVKGTVIHKGDKQPMVGAEVKVKGTSISTVTDVDGHFVLEAPADARKLVISYIGMPSTTATIKEGEELLIKMQPAERTFMPFISASPVIDGFMVDGESVMGFGGVIGLGLTCNLSQSFAISPAVEIGKTMSLFEDNAGAEFKHKPLFVQIPVMFEIGSWVKNTTKFIVGVGPYVGFNLSDSNSEVEYFSNYPSGYPFDGSGELERKGLDAGFRFHYKMHWTHFLLGFYGQIGLTDAFKEDICIEASEPVNGKHLQVGISLGYRF